jgi:hypothetical protein
MWSTVNLKGWNNVSLGSRNSLKVCVVLPRRITQRSVTQQKGATMESNKEFENAAFNALSEGRDASGNLGQTFF